MGADGQVLVVNKGMVISLLSHLGLSYFLHDSFRAMTHVSLYAFLSYATVLLLRDVSFNFVY